ncbi:Uncharacterised protein [uncultured archaeon]|nr:Uncharacterised protein [uncultured archaeon]
MNNSIRRKGITAAKIAVALLLIAVPVSATDTGSKIAESIMNLLFIGFAVALDALMKLFLFLLTFAIQYNPCVYVEPSTGAGGCAYPAGGAPTHCICTYSALGGTGFTYSVPLSQIVYRLNKTFISMFYPFYVMGILFTSIYLIFMSSSPSGRSKAKTLLIQLFMGMVLVPASPALLQMMLNTSWTLGQYVMKGAYTALYNNSAMALWNVVTYLIIIILAISSGWFVIAIALIRFMVLTLLACIWPLAMFFFFFPRYLPLDIIPDLRGIGTSIIKTVFLVLLVQFFQVVLLAITLHGVTGGFLGLFMVIGGYYAMFTMPYLGMKLMGWLGSALYVYSTRGGEPGTRFVGTIMQQTQRGSNRGQITPNVAAAMLATGGQYQIGHVMGQSAGGADSGPKEAAFWYGPAGSTGGGYGVPGLPFSAPVGTGGHASAPVRSSLYGGMSGGASAASHSPSSDDDEGPSDSRPRGPSRGSASAGGSSGGSSGGDGSAPVRSSFSVPPQAGRESGEGGGDGGGYVGGGLRYTSPVSTARSLSGGGGAPQGSATAGGSPGVMPPAPQPPQTQTNVRTNQAEASSGVSRPHAGAAFGVAVGPVGGHSSNAGLDGGPAEENEVIKGSRLPQQPEEPSKTTQETADNVSKGEGSGEFHDLRTDAETNPTIMASSPRGARDSADSERPSGGSVTSTPGKRGASTSAASGTSGDETTGAGVRAAAGKVAAGGVAAGAAPKTAGTLREDAAKAPQGPKQSSPAAGAGAGKASETKAPEKFKRPVKDAGTEGLGGKGGRARYSQTRQEMVSPEEDPTVRRLNEPYIAAAANKQAELRDAVSGLNSVASGLGFVGLTTTAGILDEAGQMGNANDMLEFIQGKTAEIASANASQLAAMGVLKPPERLPKDASDKERKDYNKKEMQRLRDWEAGERKRLKRWEAKKKEELDKWNAEQQRALREGDITPEESSVQRSARIREEAKTSLDVNRVFEESLTKASAEFEKELNTPSE